MVTLKPALYPPHSPRTPHRLHRQPDIEPDDRIHFQSDDGYTNTIRVGTITGELDADTDTLSGTIHAPWFANQTLQGRAGHWGFTWEDFAVDLDNTGKGHYFADFSPNDLLPGMGIGVQYDEPDGDRVINIIQALGLIMKVNYGHDWVEGNYEAGHTVWITVTESDGSTVKATAELTTQAIPWWGGRTGFSTNLDDPWVPDRPDIVPGDYVYGLVDNGYASTVRVGTINGELDVDADTVSGTIHANWFTQTLNARCGVWEENGPWHDFTVDPDGGSYFCDFGAMGWDLLPGQDVPVQYREPDGDWVINVFGEHPLNLHMGVNYGHDWVNGHYEAGHTIWLTATESDGVTVKATAVVTTGPIWEEESGFQTQWDDWLPSLPDTEPGDWVHGLVDNGYTGTVQIGTITGNVNSASDSIASTIAAAWITQEVDVTCYPWGAPGGAPNKHDTVFPDGVDVYSCSWDPATEWDVQPNQDIGVAYTEPDGDEVFNVFRTPWRVFLPLVLRNY